MKPVKKNIVNKEEEEAMYSPTLSQHSFSDLYHVHRERLLGPRSDL